MLYISSDLNGTNDWKLMIQKPTVNSLIKELFSKHSVGYHYLKWYSNHTLLLHDSQKPHSHNQSSRKSFWFVFFCRRYSGKTPFLTFVTIALMSATAILPLMLFGLKMSFLSGSNKMTSTETKFHAFNENVFFRTYLLSMLMPDVVLLLLLSDTAVKKVCTLPT